MIALTCNELRTTDDVMCFPLNVITLLSLSSVVSGQHKDVNVLFGSRAPLLKVVDKREHFTSHVHKKRPKALGFIFNVWKLD